MKISEVISHLESLNEKYGDLSCGRYMSDDVWESFGKSYIEYAEEWDLNTYHGHPECIMFR